MKKRSNTISITGNLTLRAPHICKLLNHTTRKMPSNIKCMMLHSSKRVNHGVLGVWETGSCTKIIRPEPWGRNADLNCWSNREPQGSWVSSEQGEHWLSPAAFLLQLPPTWSEHPFQIKRGVFVWPITQVRTEGYTPPSNDHDGKRNKGSTCPLRKWLRNPF